jgi:hypothetical protein
MQANNNQNKLLSFSYGSHNLKPSTAVTEFITQNLTSTETPSTLDGPGAPDGPSGADTTQQINTRWEVDSDQCSKGDFRL